jgi:hypothetical protein
MDGWIEEEIGESDGTQTRAQANTLCQSVQAWPTVGV